LSEEERPSESQKRRGPEFQQRVLHIKFFLPNICFSIYYEKKDVRNTFFLIKSVKQQQKQKLDAFFK